VKEAMQDAKTKSDAVASSAVIKLIGIKSINVDEITTSKQQARFEDQQQVHIRLPS
jgi:uncharacterized protein YggE